MSHNLFHLFIRKTDHTRKQLTDYPMSHADCVTMKSKFSDFDQARIEFVPADPDHGTIENHEAELHTQIALLRAENEQLKIKLSRMCGDA